MNISEGGSPPIPAGEVCNLAAQCPSNCRLYYKFLIFIWREKLFTCQEVSLLQRSNMSIEKDELLLLHSSGVLCVKVSNVALGNNGQMSVKSFTHPA